jgi:hypothetical protein
LFGTQSISEREAVISELDEISDRYGNPYLTGVMDYYKVTCLRSLTTEELVTYRNKVRSFLKNSDNHVFNIKTLLEGEL